MTHPYRNALAQRQLERAADVVAMFVRDEDRVDLLGQHAGLAEARVKLPDAQAAIDEQMSQRCAAASLDDGGVAGTAAAQAFETQHD